MNPQKQLILASTSPRRAELLKCAGISFEIIPPQADEKPLRGESPIEYAVRTAREKAQSLPVQPGRVVLGADTVVTLNGQILGKPADVRDAHAMLRMLSGQQHDVITGVCLHSADKTVCFHTSTAVQFRPISDAEIIAYIASGDPMDKAGAYAIQNGAAGMVKRIDGSYSNVVGLPLCEVIEALETF
ncbi:MAG: septum formation inhibitor Maf [Kiritimatiellaceae bacterium]|nr:septum formation inhibitor Maf [Kiritimatiellaceae bacterium]